MIYWNRDYYRYGIVYSSYRFLHLNSLGENVSYNYSEPANGSVVREGDEIIINDSLFLFDGLYFYFDSSNINDFEYDTYYFADGEIWKPLALTTDDTNKWKQDGKIEFEIPDDWVARDYGFSYVGCGFCIKFVFKNVLVESYIILGTGDIQIRNLTNVMETSLTNIDMDDIYDDAQMSSEEIVNNNFRKSYKNYNIDYGLIIKEFEEDTKLIFEEMNINLGSEKKPGCLKFYNSRIPITTKFVNFIINILGFGYTFNTTYDSMLVNTNFFMNQKYWFQRFLLDGSSVDEEKSIFNNVSWNGYGNLEGNYLIKNSRIKPIVFHASIDNDFDNLIIDRRFVEGLTYQSYRNIVFDYDGQWNNRAGTDATGRQVYSEVLDCYFPNDNEYNIRTYSSSFILSSTSTVWKHSVSFFIRTNTFQPIQGVKLSVNDVNCFGNIFIEIPQKLSNYYEKDDTIIKFDEDISNDLFVGDVLLIYGELVEILSIDYLENEITVERGLYWSIPHRLIHSGKPIFKQVEFLYSNANGEFDEDIRLIYHTRCTGTDLGGIFKDKEYHLSPFTVHLEKNGYVVQENIIETIPNMKIYNQMAVDLSEEVIIINAENKLLTNRIAGGVENA